MIISKLKKLSKYKCFARRQVAQAMGNVIKRNVWRISNCAQNVLILKCNKIVHPAQRTCVVVTRCVSGAFGVDLAVIWGAARKMDFALKDEGRRLSKHPLDFSSGFHFSNKLPKCLNLTLHFSPLDSGSHKSQIWRFIFRIKDYGQTLQLCGFRISINSIGRSLGISVQARRAEDKHVLPRDQSHCPQQPIPLREQ